MKKLLLFVSVLTLGFTSCNNDDDTTPVTPPVTDTNGVLEGRWEYLQNGTLVNGQEILSNYQHDEDCTKDFSDFLTGGVFSNYTFASSGNNGATPCTQYSDTGIWTRTNNTLTVTVDGDVETAEIMVLNATTLKIKKVVQQGATTTTFITVYKRIETTDITAPSFEGTWEYLQEVYSVNGTETTTDHEHTAGCTKDHTVITATTATDHIFLMDGAECVEETYTAPYTRSGNMVTTTVDGVEYTSEIVVLNATTLKMKSSETNNGQTIDYYTIYKRI